MLSLSGHNIGLPVATLVGVSELERPARFAEASVVAECASRL